MPRGVRTLTPEQEQQLLAQATLRSRLTNKALAKQWNISVRLVRKILERLRERDGGQTGHIAG